MTDTTPDMERRAIENRQRLIDSDPEYAATAVPWDELTTSERENAISFWNTDSAKNARLA